MDTQYLNDTLLIEKYLGGAFGGPSVAFGTSPLHKVAGVAEIFQGIAGSIYSEVMKLWDPNDPIKSILNFTATGLITIFGPWWMGLIYLISSEFFGMDFGKLYDMIKDSLVSTLKSKRSLTAQDITAAVSAATGGSAQASDHVTATFDEKLFRKMAKLHDLYRDEMVIQGMLEKNAFPGDFLVKPLFGIIKKVIAPPAAKSFIGKVLSFIFKTIVISVGKAKLGQAGRALVGGTGPNGQSSPGMLSGLVQNTISGLSKIPHKMKASSFGTTNQTGSWQEDFPVQNTKNEVLEWATQRYPQLAQHKAEVESDDSFKKVVQAIQDNNRETQYHDATFIPHTIGGQPVNSIADIVELFAGQVANKLGL